MELEETELEEIELEETELEEIALEGKLLSDRLLADKLETAVLEGVSEGLAGVLEPPPPQAVISKMGKSNEGVSNDSLDIIVPLFGQKLTTKNLLTESGYPLQQQRQN